jgi:sulfate adenylyltransferase subunit 1 (EFTu-like GTPase family)
MVGHLERPVRRVVGDFDEERHFRVIVDELDRPLGNEIGHVTVDVDRRLVLEQVRLAVAVGVLVIVDESALEPEK